MVRVPKTWIKDNVMTIYDSKDDSRIKEKVLEDINVPSGGFETDLSGEILTQLIPRKTEFKIKIPGSYGWCRAVTYSANNRPKSHIANLFK